MHDPDAQMPPEHHTGAEGHYDAQLALPLPSVAQPEPFTTITKRDGRSEAFSQQKIAAAILRAAESVGEADAALAKNLAAAVAIYLTKRLHDQPPNADQVCDAVERVLIQMAQARTALAYARYRDRRTRIRRLREGDWRALLNELEEAQQARAALAGNGHGTLFVRGSRDQLTHWDSARIVAALERETGLEQGPAKLVAAEVEEQIRRANITTLTTSLVRELVSAKLVEHGLEAYRARHVRLGVPRYDCERIIGGVTPDGPATDPAATDRILAQAVKKEYALSEVFEANVAEAHLRGALHLHYLDQIDRVHTLAQPARCIAEHGIGFAGSREFAGPARHAATLLAQIVKQTQLLQPLIAEQLNWPALNTCLAPFTRPFNDSERYQFAQMLIYEMAFHALQGPTGRPAPAIALAWTTPPALAAAPAIGPGATPTGGTCRDETHPAQQLAWAVLDVVRAGLERGTRFPGPRICIPLDDAFWRADGHQRFLVHAASLAAEGGKVRFDLYREGDERDDDAPVLGEVSINVARLAYEAGTEAGVIERIDGAVRLAAAAHEQRRQFLESLLLRGANGPLALLAAPRGGPQFDLDHGLWRISVVGLHEAAGWLAQSSLAPHAGDPASAALATAQRIAAQVADSCAAASNSTGLRLAGGQPADGRAGWRMATLDAQLYPESARAAVRNTPADQALCYAGGAALPLDHGLNPVEQARREGLAHAHLPSGACTHIALPDEPMRPATIADFVRKIYFQTRNRAVVVTGDERPAASPGKLRKETGA